MAEVLSFKQLDYIADLYIPVLLLIVIGVWIRNCWDKKYQKVISQVVDLVIGVLVVYGLRYIDILLGLFEKYGMDYSTHTAAALLLCGMIAFRFNALKRYVLISLILYFLLMVYQNYHSFSDIVVTSLWVAWVYVPVQKGINRARTRFIKH